MLTRCRYIHPHDGFMCFYKWHCTISRTFWYSKGLRVEKRTLILASSCAAFLGLGMATGGVGPALADLAKNSNSSLADVGGVFSGLFAGALVAQLFAGGI